MPTVVEAFRRGLPYDSRLDLEVTRYPCSNFDEVPTRTMDEVRVEEDAAARSYTHEDRKTHTSKRNNWRHQPYSKRDQVSNIRSSSSQDKKTNSRYLDLASYSFTVDAGGVVNALTKMGDTVRWPRRTDKPDDHGHKAEECHQLRKQVAYLLKNGHLNHLLNKKEDSNSKADKPPGPPLPPDTPKVINLIYGGSEICGLTYSAAKRFAREGPSIPTLPSRHKSEAEQKLQHMSITFNGDDTEDADHHDSLVISLYIDKFFIKEY